MNTTRERIDEIRYDVETNHHDSNGGRGCFGSTFCSHIHTFEMPFGILAEHFGITLFELADVTADHIRRLEVDMTGVKLDRYLEEYNRKY